MGSRTVRVALVAIAAAVLGVLQVEAARAATGDVLADVAAPAGGVGVAFDGANLYYTDRNGTMLQSVSPSGAARPSVPIVGAPGLNALTYDATRDVFWGVDATGLGVYRLTRDGAAALQFVIVPALDLPGNCDVLTGCSPVVTGFAYDATDDSFWYAPQGSQRVYHLNAAGQPLGWFDTNETSGSLFPECTTNGVSGLAAGKDSLYVSAGTCTRGFRYGKSDAQTAPKLGSFAIAGGNAGDVECDDRSFGATVLWVRDLADGHLRAIEIAAGTCVHGGGVPLSKSAGWMSGGGAALVEPDRVLTAQHAFHILCRTDVDGPPNNLVVNWKDARGNHNSFHLSTVLEVSCFYDFTIPADPPKCAVDPTNPDVCFNRMVGRGMGRIRGVGTDGTPINCRNCGEVSFSFADRGEPNVVTTTETLGDDGELTVTDVSNPADPDTILVACGCKRANYQAHNRPK